MMRDLMTPKQSSFLEKCAVNWREKFFLFVWKIHSRNFFFVKNNKLMVTVVKKLFLNEALVNYIFFREKCNNSITNVSL